MYVHLETATSKIKRRLVQDGWYLSRHGVIRDIYRHSTIRGIITLPRHRRASVGVAASIAKKARWGE